MSRFLLVQCKECSEKRIIYSNVTMTINCNKCGNLLAKPTGGISKLSENCKILEIYR